MIDKSIQLRKVYLLFQPQEDRTITFSITRLNILQSILSPTHYLFFVSTLQMVANKYDLFSTGVVEMAWIMLRIDSSRLFWLLFRVFSYENHEGKPRIQDTSSFCLKLVSQLYLPTPVKKSQLSSFSSFYLQKFSKVLATS